MFWVKLFSVKGQVYSLHIIFTSKRVLQVHGFNHLQIYVYIYIFIYLYILYTPVRRRMMIPLFVGAEATGRPRWPTEVLENSWQVSWSAPGRLRTPCSIIVFGDTIDSKAQAGRKVADLHYFNGGLLF
jgi:hypothetical protein